VVIVLMVAGLVTGGSMVAVRSFGGGLPKMDHYELGPDQVPSVKLVLGGERRVVSSSITTVRDSSEWVIRYQPAAGQPTEWSQYLEYLVGAEGFEFLRRDKPTDPVGVAVLTKPSVEAGFIIYLQIQWDATGYTLTALRSRQSVIST